MIIYSGFLVELPVGDPLKMVLGMRAHCGPELAGITGLQILAYKNPDKLHFNFFDKIACVNNRQEIFEIFNFPCHWCIV